MEVVKLLIGRGPDLGDDFGKGGQQIKDHTIGFDAPTVELCAKGLGHSTTVELRDRLDVEDPDLFSIAGDLLIAATSSGHKFIQGKGSGELQLFEDIGKLVLLCSPMFPPVQSGFGASGVKAPRQAVGDTL